MAKTVVELGTVIKNRGEYASNVKYYKDNVVQYQNSSYIVTSVPQAIGYLQNVVPTTPNSGWSIFAYGAADVIAKTPRVDVSQSFTDAEKKQVRANIGLGNGDIDNEPTVGSENLVKSGGVYEETAPISHVLKMSKTPVDMTLGRYTIYDGVTTSANTCLCGMNYINVIPGQLLHCIHANDVLIRISQYNENKEFIGSNDAYASITEKLLFGNTYYVRISADYTNRGYSSSNPVSTSDFVEGDFGVLVDRSETIDEIYSDEFFTSNKVKKAVYDETNGFVDSELNPVSTNLVQNNAVCEYMLNSCFVGANNTTVSTIIKGFIKGHSYRVYIKNPNWDITGVTSSGIQKFWINRYFNNTQYEITHVNKDGTVANYYDINNLGDCDFITIGGRATLGERVEFNIIDKTYIASITENVPTLNSQNLITSGAVKNLENSLVDNLNDIVFKKPLNKYEFEFNVTAGTAITWRETQKSVSIPTGSRIAISFVSSCVTKIDKILFWGTTAQVFFVNSAIDRKIIFTLDSDITYIAFYNSASDVIEDGTCKIVIEVIPSLYANVDDMQDAVYSGKTFFKDLFFIPSRLIADNGIATSVSNGIAEEVLLPIKQYAINGTLKLGDIEDCGEIAISFYNSALATTNTHISRSAWTRNKTITIPQNATWFRISLKNNSASLEGYDLEHAYLEIASEKAEIEHIKEKVSYSESQSLTSNEKRTAQQNIGLYDEKSVYDWNPEAHSALVSAKQKCNNYPISGYNSMLSFLVMTDIHTDWESFERGLQYANDEPLIDGVLVLGDIGNTPNDMRSYDYTSKITNCDKPVLTIPGNHEVSPEANPLSDTEMMSIFYNEDILAQNGEVHPTGKKWWYRDFTKTWKDTSNVEHTDTIRIIGLTEADVSVQSEGNTWSISQEQVDWFVNTLENTPSDYYVLIIRHSTLHPNVLTTESGEFTPTYYNPLGMGTTRIFRNISFLVNIVDAWINGGSVSETSEEYNSSVEVSVNHTFASAHTDKFIGFVAGHTHKDGIFRVIEHSNMVQVMLNCTANTQYQQGGDVGREYSGKSRDCLTVLTYDWFNHSIKLIRVGANVVASMERRAYQMIKIDADNS